KEKRDIPDEANRDVRRAHEKENAPEKQSRDCLQTMQVRATVSVHMRSPPVGGRLPPMPTHNKKKKKQRKPTKAKTKTIKKKAGKGKKASRSKKSAPKPKKRTGVVRSRGKVEKVASVEFTPVGRGPRSGGQSGDLQGLSDKAGADTESVDELLEEG